MPRPDSRNRALILAGVIALVVVLFPLVALSLWPLRTPTAGSPGAAYEVVRIFPHDFRASTQGLLYDDGAFYESTGRLGHSSLRRTHVGTGAVLQRHNLADEHYGEGLALVDDRLIQLTWTTGLGFIHDRDSLDELGEFTYPGEGWGLTYDGRQLILSDGTAALRFLDPDTLTETRRMTVVDSNGPVPQLNELEYVEGEIWANVYQTDRIARISPEAGQVVGYLDLTGLLGHWRWSQLWPLQTGVLNGIAYDHDTGRLFVTGKMWPAVFEIRVRGL